MEFPGLPTNPLDRYVLEDDKTVSNSGMNIYNMGMYQKLTEGWLHCFKEPNKYLPSDKFNFLISESDFVNYNILRPDPSVVKQYDFLYNCPKVNEGSPCDDWVSYNKNWELALKCLPILCKQFGLRGLLVGRKNCPLPDGCAQYLDTTGWLDYHEHIKVYDKCKFIFMPNIIDASPRVLTESLAKGLPCLVNSNILGGWKYVDEEKTGTFFTDETDIANSITKLLANMTKYNPRQYIIDNYGPVNSGRRLKEYLFTHFKDRLNVKESEVDYVTIRNSAVGFL
jgi:glycosyltransferase involved in cell wall biosynthesis